MASSISQSGPNDDFASINSRLDAVNRRMIWLTTAMFAVALALLLTVAGLLGYVIDFHAGESLLVAGACTGGTAMGFVFGWLARRAI